MVHGYVLEIRRSVCHIREVSGHHLLSGHHLPRVRFYFSVYRLAIGDGVDDGGDYEVVARQQQDQESPVRATNCHMIMEFEEGAGA